MKTLLAHFKALTPLGKWIAAGAGIAASAAIGWGVNNGMPALIDALSGDGRPVNSYVERNPGRATVPVRGAQQLQRAQIGVVLDPKIFERGDPDWTGYSYVIPRPASQLTAPPPGRCRDRARWAKSLGGADAGFTRVEVALQGRASGTVLIDDIEPIVVTRRKSMSGTWAQCPVGGASASPQMIQVNLDRNPPSVQFLATGGDPQRTPVLFTIEKGEFETFFIETYATTCLCEWKVRFSLIEAGRKHVLTVDDDGQPFRTTGTGNAKPFVWLDRRWQSGSA